MTPLEHGIFEQINRRRAQDGLRRLDPDPALCAAAREHSAAMARLRFFDHVSPVPGHETPAQRAIAANAEFVEIGENIALLSPQIATAEGFVRGWLNSPPHRENLLKVNWECSGVGVHASRSLVHATQLFSLLPDIRVGPPQFVAAGHGFLSLHASFGLDAPGELGIVLSGASLASGLANPRGQVTAEATIPTGWAHGDIAFCVRSPARAGAWRELVGGRATVGRAGAWEWLHERGPFDGVREWNIDLSRKVARTHHLWFRGEARRPSTVVVVVDGYVGDTVDAKGPFVVRQALEPGLGVREINLGVQMSGLRYQPIRTLAVDTDRGKVD